MNSSLANQDDFLVVLQSGRQKLNYTFLVHILHESHWLVHDGNFDEPAPCIMSVGYRVMMQDRILKHSNDQTHFWTGRVFDAEQKHKGTYIR